MHCKSILIIIEIVTQPLLLLLLNLVTVANGSLLSSCASESRRSCLIHGDSWRGEELLGLL